MIVHAEPIDEDNLRIRHEFLAAPDLHASVEWCSRTLGVQPRHAQLILDSLVRDGFLCRTANAAYTRTAPRLRQ